MTDITSAQLREFQLYKQGFRERIFKDFYEVAFSALGLHSTDYWTPYLSAWARLGDYDAQKVFEALNSGKKIIRRRAFRNTLHVVHIDNYGLILRSLGPQLERAMRQAPPIKHLSESEVEERISEITRTLEDGPHSMNDLKKKLPHIGEQMRWLILIADGRGQIVRTSGSHARSTRLDYELASDWLEDYEVPEIDEREGLREIIHRYIAHFGPVTLSDLAWWVPLKVGEVKEYSAELGESIVKVMVDGKEHLMVPGDLEHAMAIEESSELRVNLLPYEDHFPKAFKDRAWYITQEDEKVLFPRNREHFWPPGMKPPPPGPPKGMNASGEIRPSIWIDGKIVGRWEVEIEEEQATIKHGILAKASGDNQERIEERCIELSEFINKRLIPIS
ncbi:MAG: winged helix DNA-binding domain-containing protein [Candidatus Thorarchaeota archaeon]